jgi:exopolysaccharide biosynthesis polyprenyl glycosylphosphotransferase
MDTATSSIRTSRAIGAGSIRLHRLASRKRFIAIVQAFDFVTFWLIGLVWFAKLGIDASAYWWLIASLVSVLVATIVHCVFQCFKLYDFPVLSRRREASLRAFSAGLISIGPFLAPILMKTDIADGTAASTCGIALLGLVALSLCRLGFSRVATVLQTAGVVGHRIYIIADTLRAATTLRSALERVPDNRVVGIWNLSSQPESIETALSGALQFVRFNPVDVVILKMPLSPPDRLVEAARLLRGLPRTVLLAPSVDDGDDIILGRAVSHADQFDGFGNILLVKLSDRPLDGWRWLVKDIQDRALALLLLTFLTPLFLMIMAGIKLSDRGTIFFRQTRYGYCGDTFEIFKFRTMRTAQTEPGSSPLILTTRNDSRVFPFGRLLRRTSLDELPQLLNVLLGDMWIIGPRPHSPFARAGGTIYSKAVRGYEARYRIKPGITGWAQVSGWRGPTDTLEQLSHRVEHDLYYIENWSTFFDVKILFKTLSCAFWHENAF